MHRVKKFITQSSNINNFLQASREGTNEMAALYDHHKLFSDFNVGSIKRGEISFK